MKTSGTLLAALIATFSLAGFALGQELPTTRLVQQRSLASLTAADKFTSAEYGFTIALPAKPDQIETIERSDVRGSIFTWNFREGTVNIGIGEFNPANTEVDRATFLDAFKKGFLSRIGSAVASFTQAPYKFGDYGGFTASMLVFGRKTRLNVAVSGNKFFSVTTFTHTDVEGAEALVLKAADSFSWNARPVGPIAHVRSQELRPLK